MNDPDDNLRDLLQGRTLEVYWWLLTQKDPQTARQIKDGTGFSSVSLAKYHLKKLCEVGLAEEFDVGEYRVTQEQLIGELRFYIYLKQKLIPRHILYTTFYATVLILSIVYLFPYISLMASILIIAIILFGLVSSIFESIVLFRDRPLK